MLIDASRRDMLGVEGLKVLLVRWPLVPKAGIDHDYTQISLSHNEMNCMGGLRVRTTEQYAWLMARE